MNFAFWNVNKNENIDEHIKNFVREYNIDVMILAEYNGNMDNLLLSVNNPKERYTQICSFDACDKITGLINNRLHQEPLRSSPRYNILCIKTSYFRLIIGMIHAKSNLHCDDNGRKNTFCNFCNDIKECEKNLRIENSIIIGDFNSNPFDMSIMDISSINAVPYREELKKGYRIMESKPYKQFYNPMWRFLGSKVAPYGTYYYNNSGKSVNYYWNVFDQVIMRPSLIKSFDENSLKIVTEIKSKSLLENNYKPNKEYSDHLPIFFNLKEEKIK